MMVAAQAALPEFDWRGDGGRWIDKLTGSTRFRDMLTAGAPADEVVGAWRDELAGFDAPARAVPALPWRAAMRGLRPAAVAVGCAALLGGTLLLPVVSASAARSHPLGSAGRYDRPQDGFAPAGTVLRDSTPAGAGLDPAPIRDALDRIAGWEEPSGATRPLYAGAVALMGHEGRVVARDGERLRAALRRRCRDGAAARPVGPDARRHDLRHGLGQQAVHLDPGDAAGRAWALRLDEPVATYLPEFAAHGKGSITVRSC